MKHGKRGGEIEKMTTNFVDFRIVKERISIEQVLEHYTIRLRRTNKTSLRGFCPLPTHSSEKSRESFGVDVTKNIWSCQSTSCASARAGKKGGNILDFVVVMENCSVREAAVKLHEWFLNVDSSESVDTQTSDSSDEINSAAAKLVAGKKEEVTTGNRPLSFRLTGIDIEHQYITTRGITKESAECFGVGLFPGRGSMSGRVVIPISNERGELVAYAGRAVDDAEPKYKLPAGFKKSEVLFNLDRVLKLPESQNPIIVVEGFFDCMKVHQAGFPKVVALMGSSMSEAQRNCLITFKHIVLFLDGDEAGERASASIAAELVTTSFVKVLQLARGQQPDQLSVEQIQAVLGKI